MATYKVKIYIGRTGEWPWLVELSKRGIGESMILGGNSLNSALTKLQKQLLHEEDEGPAIVSGPTFSAEVK